MSKIINFVKELQQWKESGLPIRSPVKVKELFDICSSNECGHYIKKNENAGLCGICGCRLLNRAGGLNKLSWSTTKCPHDPPFWEEEEEYKGVKIIEEEQQKVEEEISPAPPPPPPGGCGCGG